MLRLLRLRTDGLRVQSSANSEGGVDIMKSLNHGSQIKITGGPKSVQSGQLGARFFLSVGLPITILQIPLLSVANVPCVISGTMVSVV